MPDVSSLYPQPPQQGQQNNSLLNNPAQAIGIMQGLQSLKNQQLEYQIRQGQAPETIRQPGVQNVQTETSTQGMGLEQARTYASKAAEQMSGFLAGKAARGEKISDDDIHQAYTLSSAALRDAGHLKFPQVLDAMHDGLLKSKNRAGYVLNLQNSATPAGNLIQPTPGTPGEAGEQRTTTVAGGNVPGGRRTGQAIGEEEAQKGAVQRAVALENTATTSPATHSDLENLRQDSKIMENLEGPTVETEKKLNALSRRLTGFGITMSNDQLRATESFDKIANTISANQARSLGADTDAGRHMVLGSIPSSSMSSVGREGVIDMLQGNQDAVDKTRSLWLRAKANGVPSSAHNAFLEKLNNPPPESGAAPLDPRVFQFNRMSTENQQKFLHTLDPDDVPEFERRYKYAIDQKWVKPLKKPNANQ